MTSPNPDRYYVRLVAMKDLDQKTLAWAERAPLTVTGRATSTAAPEAVFAVLADHERWPEWFPNVKKVEVLGPAAGVGARRRVSIPGAAVEELFIAWDVGERWSFTGTGAKPGFVKALVEDCILEPHGDGGTAITYSMHLEPAGPFAPLLKLASGTLTKNLTKAMRALAARAEAGA
jgi:carbon monoxide dehydrogenase subunit G